MMLMPPQNGHGFVSGGSLSASFIGAPQCRGEWGILGKLSGKNRTNPVQRRTAALRRKSPERPRKGTPKVRIPPGRPRRTEGKHATSPKPGEELGKKAGFP